MLAARSGKEAGCRPTRINHYRITQPVGHHKTQPLPSAPSLRSIQLPMHHISPALAAGFDQPRCFNLHPLACLVGKMHLAVYQFHACPGAHLAQLVCELARRTFITQKQKLFTAPGADHIHAVGLWIGVAICHLVVVDVSHCIRAAHGPRGHTHSSAFHNERFAVTRRVKAGEFRATARSLPPRHRQPCFLFHRLESRRRC
jgi:hypothetical protein